VAAVEGDPLFRMAERFSSLKPVKDGPVGATAQSSQLADCVNLSAMAARFTRPGQAFKDENNGLHANNGAITNLITRPEAIQSIRISL
jgi:hypothetical protein